MSEHPQDLFYTKDHEWIRINNHKGTIGITEYAQNQLGDIVYIELPEIEEEIDAGDEFGTVESVKASSAVLMPVSGTVIDTNTELSEQPEIVNDDCYGDGWMIRIDITNIEDKEALMSAEEYATYLEENEE